METHGYVKGMLTYSFTHDFPENFMIRRLGIANTLAREQKIQEDMLGENITVLLLSWLQSLYATLGNPTLHFSLSIHPDWSS